MKTIATAVVCIVVMFLTFFFGYCSGRSYTEIIAIKAKVAHWTINPETGERKLEFIQPKQ